MLNTAEVWLELYKLVYQNNCNKLSFFVMAGHADQLLKEYLNRYPTEVRIKGKQIAPANQSVSWSNPNSQTPNTRY
jgi:hypothetical protein